ncbi:hypothetical protein BKA70DRAFT_1238181 [Coprinopsis sp. MPI-PUGE-AT-0042]|nr:hypothetical protein BKA70DRAFT_1238181 [Coprinopsis sp. MPI-PUGE-AT-0042]
MDPVFQLGENFACTVDPFVGLAQMVQMETKEVWNYVKCEEDWRNIKTSKDRREHQGYTTLLRLLSLQGEDFVDSTPTICRHIICIVGHFIYCWSLQHLSKGQFKAWSEDFRASQSMLSQHLALDGNTVGSLLCPATCDRHKEGMERAICSDPYIVRIGCWPNVFYQNQEVDTQDPWKGFLKNSLLVMVAASSRLPGIDLHATPASIAYVATLVTAALDVQDVNTKKCARQTFTILLQYLYDHHDNSRAKELNCWWDQPGFRQLQGLRRAKPSFSNGQPTSGRSMLDRLKAQRIDE